MSTTKKDRKFTHLLAPQLTAEEELQGYEVSFRRWLGRHLHSGAVTSQQAIDELGLIYQAFVTNLHAFLPNLP